MFRVELRLILLFAVAEDANDRREPCLQLTFSLDGFSNVLMANLQRFSEVGDKSGVETIWACCVTCLAHLTALSHLLSRRSQREPTLRSSMDDLYDLTLNKLGALSCEVHVEVYSHFDVLTEVRVLVVFLRMCQALRVLSDLFEKGSGHH